MQRTVTVDYEAIANYEGLNAAEQELYDRAFAVRTNAYAVYSNFTVGCAILLENGEIIVGSNQENAVSLRSLCRTHHYFLGTCQLPRSQN